jgi:hypothetical protein
MDMSVGSPIGKTKKDPIFLDSPGSWKRAGRMKDDVLLQGYKDDKEKFTAKLQELYPSMYVQLQGLNLQDKTFIMKVLRTHLDYEVYKKKHDLTRKYKEEQKKLDESMQLHGKLSDG